MRATILCIRTESEASPSLRRPRPCRRPVTTYHVSNSKLGHTWHKVRSHWPHFGSLLPLLGSLRRKKLTKVGPLKNITKKCWHSIPQDLRKYRFTSVKHTFFKDPSFRSKSSKWTQNASQMDPSREAPLDSLWSQGDLIQDPMWPRSWITWPRNCQVWPNFAPSRAKSWAQACQRGIQALQETPKSALQHKGLSNNDQNADGNPDSEIWPDFHSSNNSQIWNCQSIHADFNMRYWTQCFTSKDTNANKTTRATRSQQYLLSGNKSQAAYRREPHKIL